MRNGTGRVLLAAAGLSVLAARLMAAGAQIEADTSWTGEKTLDDKVVIAKGTLTIEPGAKIVFKSGGEINVRPGATLAARGTEDKPVEFVGSEKAGIILADKGAVILERCRLSDMAGQWSNRPTFLWASCGAEGVILRNCTLTDCGGAWVTADNGPFEMFGCDLRRQDKLFAGDGGLFMLGGKSKITLANNTFRNVTPYSAGGDAEVVVRDNVFVSCGPSGFKTSKTLVEGNYVHQPLLNGSYGLLNLSGTIRDNVVRGGTWTTCRIGGTITGNVFETLSPEDVKKSAEAGFKDGCTHENVSTFLNNSVLARNLIINYSYGAVMGAADGVCTDCVIRNNTFDLRGGTAPVWLNHLPRQACRNLVIRGNLFLRTGRIYDEAAAADCISYADYNLWAGTAVTSPSADCPSQRFVRITITGKKEGDEGFGAHDLAPEKKIAVKDVVVNPDFVLAFSDEEMLARKHTAAQCLELYRAAYTLKPASPAIGAGDPADKDDPENVGGRCDCGAISFAGEAAKP